MVLACAYHAALAIRRRIVCDEQLPFDHTTTATADMLWMEMASDGVTVRKPNGQKISWPDLNVACYIPPYERADRSGSCMYVAIELCVRIQ